MRITVLDGYGLNPGDMSWEWLGKLGDYEVFDRTPQDLVYERTKDSDAVIINKIAFDKELLDRLPNLKYIGITATGYNIVDTEYAFEKDIVVTNVPAYSTDSVAQHTFTLLLELLNRSSMHDLSVKDGRWSENNDFCYWLKPQTELSGKTLGIIGGGKIGMKVAAIAEAFGMKTVSCGSKPAPGRIDIDELLKTSDVISLHCPLNKETEQIINKANISKMKDGVYIVNTARGGLINEYDVSEALKSGKIAGFAADVLSTEPPAKDNAVITSPNTLITPHIAWATFEARTRLMEKVKENFECFVIGKIQNRVR